MTDHVKNHLNLISLSTPQSIASTELTPQSIASTEEKTHVPIPQNVSHQSTTFKSKRDTFVLERPNQERHS